ncbi:MAG: 4-carboxymuconolactone decarboxylase [Nitratireductor sp.]|nr:4-carboxymuconolactone decarboxylase [Nitratireductor sp.]
MGERTRREVLGDSHVDRSIANMSEFDRPFVEFLTRTAWGGVWSSPALSRRERSMITIALLAALGREEELALHIRATANTGASAQDIREALMHVGVYAGIPAANSAFRIARKILSEREEDGQ